MEKSMQIIGYLGDDAQSNVVNGSHVINFNVAVRGNEKPISDSDWISCSFWINSEKLTEVLKKGILVFIKGDPSVNMYQKKDITIPFIQIRVTDLKILSKRVSVDLIDDPLIQDYDIPF